MDVSSCHLVLQVQQNFLLIKNISLKFYSYFDLQIRLIKPNVKLPENIFIQNINLIKITLPMPALSHRRATEKYHSIFSVKTIWND